MSEASRLMLQGSSVKQVMTDQLLKKLIPIQFADKAASVVVVCDIGRILGQQVTDDLIDRVVALLTQSAVDCGQNGLHFSGSSDAPAEFVAKIRRLCDEGGVIWQMGELGKVDAGGGGTVAQYMADRNILTLDTGVPVLSMHAPIEVVSKLDCYETTKAMRVFYLDR